MPAGSSLPSIAGFARLVTERIAAHRARTLMAEEMPAIPDRPTIIASGPLTSPSLTQSIGALTTRDHLYFTMPSAHRPGGDDRYVHRLPAIPP